MNELVKIKRALLSVSDKTDLLTLAKKLNDFNIEMIASGGTAKTLMESGYKVTPVEKLSGHGEAFQGRMKTLSFEISSSLLFKRGDEKDKAQAVQLKIEPIDLVVVNLYPFHQTVERGAELSEVIENIDIGGPTLLRAGAKNYQSVAVLSSPNQYREFISQLIESGGGTVLESRKKWSAEAYTLTAFYDLAVSGYLATTSTSLRYGENPHQKAVALKNPFEKGLLHTEPLAGKEMSYNNYLDADFALQTLKDLHHWRSDLSAAVVVKHNTPCGIALHQDPLKALDSAWKGDEKSSFGGVLALNFPLTETIAQFFEGKFVEVIMAPQIDRAAINILKKNCRLIEVDLQMRAATTSKNVRTVDGGLLVQDKDRFQHFDLKWVTQNKMSAELSATTEFAFICVKNLKSNAISLAQNIDTDNSFELLTMGSGQTNRIDCIEKLIASRLKDKNVNDLTKVVLASDAFFPFADSVQAAAQLGIKTIVQPGGSVKDPEVIAEADKLGLAMAFTGRRHFLH